MRVKVIGPMAALLLVTACADQATTETETETMTSPMTPEASMSAQEDLVINVGDRVFFDFDKSDLRPDAIDTLNRQSDWMSANGSITVGQAVS
jgi:peptidoglycan-associated lipoprotein